MEDSNSKYRGPVLILIVVLILIIAGLVYVGQQYGPLPPPAGSAGSRPPLTDAQKAEILKSLQLPP